MHLSGYERRFLPAHQLLITLLMRSALHNIVLSDPAGDPPATKHQQCYMALKGLFGILQSYIAV